MTWVAGADGCRGGWFRAARETETGELVFHVVAHAADLVAVPPRPRILGIDIPIGLTEAGRRDCDTAARKLLGHPRASSVFPAPVRPALKAATRLEASDITQRLDGRRVGAQAWNIYAKIREVDELLQRQTRLRERIREVHPEVAFCAWSGGKAIVPGKKTTKGQAQRLKLAEAWLAEGVLAAARGNHLKKTVADDDILDAIAVLWTATRIHRGEARTLPELPPLDATGLRMKIVY